MVKERENALSETDPYSVMDEVQGRFPKDDLRLHQAPTEIGAAVTASTANLNNNNNGNNSNKNDNIISNNNNNNNNKNDNNSSSSSSSSNATTTALSGSPVFQDVSPSSPHASRFGQLAPKNGTDSGLASSPSTPSTPEDELGRDRKDTGCDYSGNSSPSLANRGGTSNINNNNNNNNSKKHEDKEAAMVSRFPTW